MYRVIYGGSSTLNWEIFATNNIRDFHELTLLANFFVVNTPAHIPKYRYRQCMVRLAKFLVAIFSAYQIWHRFTKFTVRKYFLIWGILCVYGVISNNGKESPKHALQNHNTYGHKSDDVTLTFAQKVHIIIIVNDTNRNVSSPGYVV